MANQSSPDLVKVTEVFLVPSSFLVAALGTADTNAHRALASLLGLLVSILWRVCSDDAMSEQLDILKTSEHPASLTRRVKVLAALPWVFIVGWLLSTVIHALLWKRPLGS